MTKGINMDRMLRADVVATVRQAITDALEGSNEVWLTADQVTEQFGMLSREWLHRYGFLLDRERAEVKLADGTVKVSRWAYPKHRLQRMIREGRLKELMMKAKDIVG